MMQPIADLLDACLEALVDLGIEGIDEMPEFVSECEIEQFWAGPGYDPYNFLVTFPALRYQFYVWQTCGGPSVYHTFHMDSEPCPTCYEVVAPHDLREGGCKWCVKREVLP